ncbi:MAG: ATP-NAD kinase family protein [Chloroflexi bacterium]|nr:ATP-NAD kinase family protein [Chloroflexota bacterium]
MRKIGFMVNPVAGMGGAVGLKGTDGEMYLKALELGASPVSPGQAIELLRNIRHKEEIYFLSAPGMMGETWLNQLALQYEVVGKIDGKMTTSQDTIRIGREILEKGAEMIIFVGGDGTARDIYQVVGVDIPVIAVPAGVKIFSGIFAISARAAASLVDEFVEGSGFTTEEILDIDEAAYRNSQLQSQLFGYMMTPQAQAYIQHSKSPSDSSGSELEDQLASAEWVVEQIKPDTLYLLGPGTTIKAVTEILELPKTLLGIDALYNGRIIQADLNENDILALFDKYPKRFLVVTPIGGNGFIFGRGNKQFTAQVIKQVGIKNVIVVSTPEKVSHLIQLRVDTHDEELDKSLSGYRQIIIGYRESRMMKVV